MTPLFTHCPHCAFPIVVRGIERVVPRRCRQCREEYMPGIPLRRDQGSAGDARLTVAERQRASLRAQVKQRRRLLK